MTNQITVTLSDETFHRAERFANLSGQPVAEIIAQTVEEAIPSISLAANPVSELSDTEIQELANWQMTPEESQRQSELLERQGEGLLTDEERVELWGLTQIYRLGLLRKSQAQAEVVARGLAG